MERELNNVKLNVEFEESENREKLSSGENISILLGKINKYLSDLKSVSFSNDFNDLENKPKQISFISVDSANNILVTYKDGTTEFIGKFDIDVQADFLTENGFGNLRFYNSQFQYYDDATSLWVDASVSNNNPFIVKILPQEMQEMYGTYDKNLKKNKLLFKEPEDTIVDKQVISIIEKIVIRRKLGEVPSDENDGILVTEILRKDFGTHENIFYVDEALTPSVGETWYYKAFPVSTTGMCNYSDKNEISILCREYDLYGFKISQKESNPSSMITYIEDNEYYKSAHMDYTSGEFDYGDWGNVWFIRNLKPCMLRQDGTVAYELNRNDYSKKIDGTDSDIANESFEGNAMIGFPKVYWKIVNNGDDTANVYFSNEKLDDNFVCWSHIDNNGDEIDYCYMPIYNGSVSENVLRSLSNKVPIYSKTGTQEIEYAKANNKTDDIIWYTEVYSDRVLVNLLLLLIGKSTNTQDIFGNGYYTKGTETKNPRINTGSMDTKGLFWGSNDSSMVGVKVFGMEHWWGNQFRRIAGWICNKGTQKVKMTYGQSDGSTVNGYNTDGSGYITIPSSIPGGSNGGYISKMIFTDKGFIPKTASGSSTTYYVDGMYFDNTVVAFARVGGGSANVLIVGAFCSGLDASVSDSGWHVGAAVSCKPLALKG